MQKAKTDICNQQVVGSSPTNGSIKKSPVNNAFAGFFNLLCRRAEDAATQLYLISTVKPPQSSESKASWISSPVESF